MYFFQRTVFAMMTNQDKSVSCITNCQHEMCINFSGVDKIFGTI